MPIGCGQPGGSPSEASAVAAVRQLKGKVEFDDKSPDRPVIKVYLHGTEVLDADLARLKDFKKLQNLFLGRTKISDAGLEHLKDLTQLQTLSLNSTSVTDIGLKHLVGLRALKTLNLQECQVTTSGVAELKKSLLEATIAR